MRHDPERAAAAYLAGELRAADRERFETHMLGCDECWREVRAGRDGRALAESLREVAPQHLRERVRATIAAAPAGRPARRRRRVRLGTTTGMPALLGAVAALAVVLAVVLAAGGLLAVREHRHQIQAQPQPAPIAAAVASYRAGTAAWHPTTEQPPARRLGELTWRGSGRGELAGLPVVAHAYQDAAGHRVVVLVTDRPFPQAAGARHEPADARPGAGADAAWEAEVDGVAMFCADHPAPSLVVGADRAEVLTVAQRLGLR